MSPGLPWELPTVPYQHQWQALAFCDGRPFYALLMEQGTGKTPVVAWDLARRFVRGEVSGALVMAPNGVQSNWVLRELPTHMPRAVPWQAAAWHSGANKKQQAAVDDLFAPAGDRLKILTMNWEALNTEAGYEIAAAFLKSMGRGAAMAADESQRIKNTRAGRTKAAFKLKPHALALRIIMSGTPIVKSPWDAFSQFGFLSTSILQTTSYYAFKAEYAELLPAGHGLLRHIADRLRPQVEGKFARVKEGAEALLLAADETADPVRKAQLLERAKLEINRYQTLVEEELQKRTPQLVAKDPLTGLPKWRNLAKLDALIAPHAFRVLKKDCLDLPEKIYTTRWFKMTAKQAGVQELLKNELRLVLADGTIEPVARLAALNKLAQVSSGYFLVPGTDIQQRIMPLEKNPKMAVLMEEVETCLENGESVLIWARYQAELRDIAIALNDLKAKQDNTWTYAEYHGDIGSKTARQQAIDDFESGKARVFLSQQQAGGTGLTLIAKASMAATMSVIYYSNTWALEDRLQSEDRAHRIGQSKSVRYVDILGEGTIDLSIVEALKAKIDVAQMVTGDARRAAAALGLAQ